MVLKMNQVNAVRAVAGAGRAGLALGACAWAGAALAWGHAGHSAVAEIAQRRLAPEAAAQVAAVLGPGWSLASVASWPDEIRAQQPSTGAWHFVNIPGQAQTYDAAKHCGKPEAPDACVVAQLQRLRNDLRCAPTVEAKREALMWTVHLVGDIHQPLHAYDDLRGGNDLPVTIKARGPVCGDKCKAEPTATNLHAAWDSGLLDKLAPTWGALVAQVEGGWLATPEAHKSRIDGGTPADWANDSHSLVAQAWVPANTVLDDDYLARATPVLMRQIGLAGLRLARVLNEAYAGKACPRP
jgi:hypothetical protein